MIAKAGSHSPLLSPSLPLDKPLCSPTLSSPWHLSAFLHVWLFFLTKTGFSKYSQLLHLQMLGFKTQRSIMYTNIDFCINNFENGVTDFCEKQVMTKTQTITGQISSFSSFLSWTITFFPLGSCSVKSEWEPNCNCICCIFNHMKCERYNIQYKQEDHLLGRLC